MAKALRNSIEFRIESQFPDADCLVIGVVLLTKIVQRFVLL